MNDLEINRGFEAMIPKKKQEKKPPLFRHNLIFKLFNKRIQFLLEIKTGAD
jgi:hypothetical protein